LEFTKFLNFSFLFGECETLFRSLSFFLGSLVLLELSDSGIKCSIFTSFLVFEEKRLLV
jgi:hypothetical protein